MTMVGKMMKAMLAVALAAGALMLGSSAFAADKAAPAPTAPAAEKAVAPATEKGQPIGKVRTVEITVNEKGYQPSPITLKKDEPVRLLITRKVEHTCATEIIIDEHNINAELPLNKQVEVSFTPTKTGKLKYGCAMGKMIAGVFLVQ